MFIGHYAAGLALKRADKSLSLGWLFLAATWIDLAFDILVLSDIEHAKIVPGILAANSLVLYDYPISHGLVAALVWSLVAFLIFRFAPILKAIHRTRAALVLAIAVFSHWILDLVTHAPDLPILSNDSPKIGLGLWNNLAASIIVEILVFVAGLWIYLRSTRAKSFGGKYGIVIVAVILLALFLTSFLGTPPTDMRMMAWVGLILSLVMVAIGFWLDRKRQPI